MLSRSLVTLGRLCTAAAVVTSLTSLALPAAVAMAPAPSAVSASRQTAAPVAAIPKIITAATAAAGYNPGANIPLNPSYPGICQTQPTSTSCQTSAISTLNNGRAAMGLPAYKLPAGFQSMAPTSQLLVLSNLDRATYGLVQITGLNATLSQAAARGIATDVDPSGPGTVDGNGYSAWTANWAAGWASALYTYYEWMYYDGYGDGRTNIDCTSPGDSGCWGHRNDTLTNFGNTQVGMGVASGTSPRYGMPAFAVIYESFSPAARLTWQVLAATLQPMPVGHVDAVSNALTSVTLSGWAFDPTSTSTSTRVDVYVGGAGHSTIASGLRADVKAAFGLASAAHGFNVTLPLQGGTSTACAYAIDVGGASNSLIGCWPVTSPTGPMGHADAVSNTLTSVTLSGWAFDPRATSTSTRVDVYVGGAGHSTIASGLRADVKAAFGLASAAHGFNVTVPLPGGTWTVCAYAIDAGGARNSLIGCWTVTSPTAPMGHADTVTNTSTSVTLSGWAFDPRATSTSTRVDVYVGGAGHSTIASGLRADVKAAFGLASAAHGFNVTVPLPGGTWTVCAYAIDAGGARNSLIGCWTAGH